MRDPRRPVRGAGVASLMAASTTAASAQRPSIVGRWEGTRKKNGRVEQLDFRDDGTVAIQRGEERTENTDRMSWAPGPNGRYRLALVTVRDHGGCDCEDSAEDSMGRRSVVYVLLGQSRESMIFFTSPEGADCTGLMRRIAR